MHPPAVGESAEQDMTAVLAADEVERHVCCMKPRLCKDDHFHQRDVERILSDRLAAVRADSEARAERAEAALRAVEAVACRWADALAEVKAMEPNWILDRSVTTVETALNELRAALAAQDGAE